MANRYYHVVKKLKYIEAICSLFLSYFICSNLPSLFFLFVFLRNSFKNVMFSTNLFSTAFSLLL